MPGIVACTIYRVKGELEFGLDDPMLAAKGAKCEEYQAIIDFVKSGRDVKETQGTHLVRALASMMDEVGAEETAQGPIILVEGHR